MSTAAHISMRSYAATEWPTLNHKGRLAKLCRELSWSNRRVRAVYNGETGVSLRADEQAELDALIQEARHDFRELDALAASLHALLYGPEADVYRPQVDAIRAALAPQGQDTRGSGGTAGPGSDQTDQG